MNKNIEYKKCIITFIDILGFKDLMGKVSPGEICRMLSDTSEHTKPFFELYEPLSKVYQFSDSIIRVLLTDVEDKKTFPDSLLFFHIMDLVLSQANLIQKGVLLRGGMAYGDLYISNEGAFGPAFIEAYEIECNYALYPRIAISPKLISELNDCIQSRHDEDKPLNKKSFRRLLRDGDDGIFYIDYAENIEAIYDNTEKYLHFIQKHRELIIEGAKINHDRKSVLNKYLWLAKYHNSVVSKKYLDKSGLLISNEIPFLRSLS